MSVEDVIEAVNVTDDAVVEMLATLENHESDLEYSAYDESETKPHKIIKLNSQS